MPALPSRPAPLARFIPPSCSWQATVASLGWEDVAGRRRLVATVDLSASPGRYPAPSWWAGADAYAASSLNDLAQPSAFVCIHGQRLRLAAVPRGDGGLLRVDVTDAAVPVRPGDSVCLLGDERGLKDLADVSRPGRPARSMLPCMSARCYALPATGHRSLTGGL